MESISGKGCSTDDCDLVKVSRGFMSRIVVALWRMLIVTMRSSRFVAGKGAHGWARALVLAARAGPPPRGIREAPNRRDSVSGRLEGRSGGGENR
jgi:hypothetical protein